MLSLAVAACARTSSLGADPPSILASICASVPAAAAAAPSARADAPPVLLTGLGYAGIEPDTANAEARRWFKQGVRLVWAFDEEEAVRAFRQAQAADPACAMCWWGEAWALGPTINLRSRAANRPAASRALAASRARASRLGAGDRELLDAMGVRVAGDAGFDSAGYAAALDALAGRRPTDTLVAVLAADAEMVLRGPDGWAPGSKAQVRLEQALAAVPDHTGAIHYYIHLTDWLRRQSLAERHADRLAGLAPAASHLVHMPSHTFLAVGRYGDAKAANVRAIEADRRFARVTAAPASVYRTALGAHNVHFAIIAALMEGDTPAALAQARTYAAQRPDLDADAGLGHLIRASVYYAHAAGGPPAEVLALPEPGARSPLPAIMRRYARGEALARAGRADALRQELDALRGLRAAADFAPLGGSAAAMAANSAAVAQAVLEGRLAQMRRDLSGAAAAYRRAADLQEAPRFPSDPPPFWYPVRRDLAATLIEQGRPADAKRELQRSLALWPKDPVALALVARAAR